jgi:hypothetical protein
MTTVDFTRRHARTDVSSPPRLAVLIPALNEEATIGSVIAAVPRRIPGVSEVMVVLVDDGSTDATRERALAAGVDRVVVHRRNRGLVATFNDGVRAALAMGAEILVHLDGDGQHDPSYIPAVIAPILRGNAELVVGVRPLAAAHSMSRVRRYGNRVGSWFFRRAFRIGVGDVTSGYRAFSREALLQLNVVSDYTYTLESLIQAARKRLAVAEVPVPTREREVGESRMTRSVVRYVRTTAGQALRIAIHSAPLAVFSRAALAMLLTAVGLAGWFVFAYSRGGMHLPALLASVLAAVISVGLFVCGLVADGVSSNRRLLEDALYRIKRLEVDLREAHRDDERAAAQSRG